VTIPWPTELEPAEAHEAILDEFRIERVMGIYEDLFSQLASPR